MKKLFPEILPFNQQYFNLPTHNGIQHVIYIEQCGNKNGIPVVVLHGGPGSGCNANHRRFFDPEKYHIILFDQRGCGRSKPLGELQENNTKHLINDIELIRQHLAIEKWLVFGGSWGATLALSYAKQFTDNVTGLILRGIFLARKKDIDWVYSASGAAKFFPDIWQQLVKHITSEHKDNPLSEIFTLINKQHNPTQINNTLIFLQCWERHLVSITPSNQGDSVTKSITQEDHTASIIQLYYSLHQFFIDNILTDIKKLTHLPIDIIHGRYDMVCPIEQAFTLKKHLPHANLHIVEQAGHIASEPAIEEALIAATDRFIKLVENTRFHK